MTFTADFETVNKAEDCRVWLYGLCEVDNTDNFHWGTSIDQLMEWAEKGEENHTLYFHHQEFDGEFLVYWCLINGFTHVKGKKDLESRTFTTLITDAGRFYTMTICFKKEGHHSKHLVINDSLKLIPLAIADIPEAFNLPIRKLDLEYNKERPIGYIPTAQEIAYLKNDVSIPALALREMFSEGFTKLTTASNALDKYQDSIGGKKRFRQWFPLLDYDLDAALRDSYKGGFVYVHELFIDRVIHGFNVFDVNSLYPFVMRTMPLPYGAPLKYEGEYQDDPNYPLYIQVLRTQFELKPEHIPTVQIKHVTASFIPTEYLKSSVSKDGEDEEVLLVMTSVDLALFKEHYTLFNTEYIEGYKFKTSSTMFAKYVDTYSDQKIKAKEEGNAGKATQAKLLLNSLYGKFGLNPNVCSKIPYLCPIEHRTKYKLGEPETRDSIYVPLASFVTAWARNITIRSAQANYDTFMYADTDSLHLAGEFIPPSLEVHPTQLGAWKHELVGYKAKYLGQKAYFESGWPVGKKPSFHMKKMVTVAGMPKSCHKYVDLCNFHVGSTYPEKLRSKKVRGGTILYSDIFSFRKRLTKTPAS